MRVYFSYFGLEYKRAFKGVVSMILAVIASLILMIAALTGVTGVMNDAKKIEIVHVDVAAEGDQSNLGLISALLNGTDSVKSICTFYFTDKAEAESDMNSGKADAAIFLSDDFYNDVNNGVNTPVNVIMGSRLPLSEEVFKELIRDGVAVIQTTEAAVYSVTDVSGIYEMTVPVDKMQSMITDVFVGTAFNRGSMFDEVVLSATGEVDMYQYYTVSFITIMMLMMGMGFGYMYRKDSIAVEEKLKMFGISSAAVSFVRIIVMSSILWLMAAALVLIVPHVDILEDYVQIYPSAGSILMLFIPSFSMSCFFHMIYSLGERGSHAGMIMLLTDTVMIIISGLIIPAALLPGTVSLIGSAAPLHFWFAGVMNDLFGDVVNLGNILYQVLYGLVFAVIGELLLWKNT